MASRAEEALQLAEEITDLRRLLRIKEAEFFRLVGDKAIEINSESAATKRGDASIADRIRGVLRADPSRAFSVDDICRALPDVDVRTIRGTVARLSKGDAHIKRFARGKYRYRLADPRMVISHGNDS